jgi:hypothetical protein
MGAFNLVVYLLLALIMQETKYGRTLRWNRNSNMG